MLISLVVSLLILLVVVFVLLYKIYKYSIIILNMEEAIETSIDIFEERLTSMEKILEKEVFFDSVEVRQVINDIKISRDAVLTVSSVLIGEKAIEENSKDKS